MLKDMLGMKKRIVENLDEIKELQKVHNIKKTDKERFKRQKEAHYKWVKDEK